MDIEKSESEKRATRYQRVRRALSASEYLLNLTLLLVLLLTGWSVSIRIAAEHVSPRPSLALLVYLVIFGAIARVLGLPLEWVSGFWLERRYGLSNLTFLGWAKDQLKALAVGGVLGAAALEFIYWSIRKWPAYWWVVCGGAFVCFIVLVANLAPILLFPIFFKFEPLENASLTNRLLALCQRARTRVRGVFEWKLSEKTKKANAALAGLGNTRRIIVSDTLIQNFTEDEIEVVLAHELGHHVHRHLARGLAVQTAAAFLGFYLIHLSLEKLSGLFGFRAPADFANLPLLLLVGACLSLVLLPVANGHSRAMERQADAYALGSVPFPAAFISSMEKLARLNLAERRPPRWIEFLFHSHPSIEKRIAFARRSGA